LEFLPPFGFFALFGWIIASGWNFYLYGNGLFGFGLCARPSEIALLTRARLTNHSTYCVVDEIVSPLARIRVGVCSATLTA